MSSHPARIGGAPVDIVGAHVEHIFHRRVDADHIAAVNVNDALRLAGRARGVQHVERRFGVEVRDLGIGGRERHDLVIPDVTVGIPLDLVVGPLDVDDTLDRRTLADRVVDDTLQPDHLAAIEVAIGGDHCLRLGILDSVAQSLGGEAGVDD